jgi:hypothetical protein
VLVPFNLVEDDMIVMQAGRRILLAWLALFGLLLVVCGQGAGTPPQPPTFTPQGSSTPAPSGPLTVRTMPPPDGDSPLPALLAEIQGPAGSSIVDMFLGKTTGHLYVLDESAQVHVLDADTYVELATIAPEPQFENRSGPDYEFCRFTLDEMHNRLYVSIGDAAVLVVDTVSLSRAGTLTPGGPVAVDSARNRVYVGTQRYWAKDVSHVRVYDGATLKEVGEIARSGVVGYNPARDEVCILGPDRIYLVDASTLESAGELCVYGDCSGERYFLPTEVGSQATDLHVFAERNLLAVEYYCFRAGKPGSIGLPRFFDAVTLDEVPDWVRTAYQLGCQDQLLLTEPVDGLIYQGPRQSDWLSDGASQDLVVYDLDGSAKSRLSGLPVGVVNPSTGQMYSPYNGRELQVLDLKTLSPLGLLACDCIHTLDAELGRIYGFQNGWLVVFLERGRQLDLPPTGKAGSLPSGEAITLILPSPNYENDGTIFVGTNAGRFLSKAVSKLYRSTDGGQTWSPLGDRLPRAGEGTLLLDLAISPDFAHDRTLFAGGVRGGAIIDYEGRGEGLYRSTDGGDTWQPVWKGLTELFIQEIDISPDFAEDGTVTATCARAWFRSTDRGQSWALGARVDYGGPRDWRFCLDPQQQRDCFNLHAGQGPFWAPGDSGRHVSYVLTECDLFRSIDDGVTWQRWLDERLADLYCNGPLDKTMTAGAISPLLSDGSYRLFVGTGSGQFWVLDPEFWGE